MRRVRCAHLPTLDPLVSFAPAYLVVEEHSCPRQQTNNAANPLSYAGCYYCVQCREKNTQATLYPFNSFCTLHLVVVNLHLLISSSQSFTSNADKYTTDRPFAAYDCPPTDTVVVQPHSNILHKCWVECVEVGLLLGRRWKTMRRRVIATSGDDTGAEKVKDIPPSSSSFSFVVFLPLPSLMTTTDSR